MGQRCELAYLGSQPQLTVQIDVGGLNEMARDRNRLCIEDPFEISYNVARTVTKDGLYTASRNTSRIVELTIRFEESSCGLHES